MGTILNLPSFDVGYIVITITIIIIIIIIIFFYYYFFFFSFSFISLPSFLLPSILPSFLLTPPPLSRISLW